MKGRILKGVGGYYTVLAEDGGLYTLKARGRFRLDEVTPLPGDYIEFEPRDDDADGSIAELLERENLLLRPRVANVDVVLAVVSASSPEPDYLLLDKLCANATMSGIRAVAVMNKSDMADAGSLAQFNMEYAAFSPISCSGKTGENIDAIKREAYGMACCFAGQSGVGKSSIINSLLGSDLETGGLSKKTERGKHTTRHAELLLAGDGKTMIVDTPGFSLIELPVMEPEELGDCYPEYNDYLGQCKFSGCLHDSEPGCAVKQAVERGDIPQGRWERYKQLLADIKNKWRNRYE